jgi:hypothetical protein
MDVHLEQVYWLRQERFPKSPMLMTNENGGVTPKGTWNTITATHLRVGISWNRFLEMTDKPRTLLEKIMQVRGQVEEHFIWVPFAVPPVNSGIIGGKYSIYRDGLITWFLKKTMDNLLVVEMNFVNDKGWTIATIGG